MAYAQRTNARLASAASIVVPSMTDLELSALSMEEIDYLFDPAEPTPHDRIRSIPWTNRNGVPTTITGSNYPALSWADAGSDVGEIRTAYTIPPSYFIACVAELNDGLNARLAGSQTNDGKRLAFGVINTNTLRLDHGAGTGFDQGNVAVAGLTVTGRHVFWGTYDAASGLADIGMDAVSPLASGVLTGPHKAQTSSAWFGDGSAGTGDINGKGAIVAICSTYLGGDLNATRREALLRWLATDVAGIALGA